MKVSKTVEIPSKFAKNSKRGGEDLSHNTSSYMLGSFLSLETFENLR